MRTSSCYFNFKFNWTICSEILALYQLEIVPVPNKDTNTEPNILSWLQARKDHLAMTEVNYISLTTSESYSCKHIGHEYFCHSIFLVRHKTSQSCLSTVLFDLPDIVNDNCDFSFFHDMTPKSVILNAEETLLLNNLVKPWYLHCNEHNNEPISIPANDYTVNNRSFLCDCQLQGENEFLHEFSASCPSADKVDGSLYFTIKMAFDHQLQINFPKAAPPKNITSNLTDTEPSFFHLTTRLYKSQK